MCIVSHSVEQSNLAVNSHRQLECVGGRSLSRSDGWRLTRLLQLLQSLFYLLHCTLNPDLHTLSLIIQFLQTELNSNQYYEGNPNTRSCKLCIGRVYCTSVLAPTDRRNSTREL